MENKAIYTVRDITNLKDMLEQSAKLFGDRDAFLIKNSDSSYTGIKYTEFKTDVDALGTALIDLGLKDSYIAVIGENRYEWCVTYLATVNGTGVIVPLDKELPQAEIENLLSRSGASAIVFSGKYEKEIQAISSTLPTVKYFINVDAKQDENFYLSFKQLINKGKKLLAKGNKSFINAQIDEEKMSILLFTSGTTDLAKGVMLSHKNICSNVMAVCSTIYLDCNDSALSILPLHHTYECTCGFFVMIYNGCTVSFNEGLKHIAKNLKETKPTLLFMVPLILESMYKRIWDQASKKKSVKFKLKIALSISNLLYNRLGIDVRRKLFKQIHENIGGRVRLIISGAAAINPEVSKGFRAMGIQVLQGYGLTECSPIVTVNREQSFRHESAGLALPGVDVKINNPNSDGIGEIVVKGPNVMLGYFKNETATQKVLKDDWFYTGDLGHMDSSGFVYITGRQKNVIVTKNGKNIFPEEVEAYLNNSPYIKESLVWGKDDEDSGETYVTAQIVPDYDAINQKLNVTDVSQEDVFKIINNEVKSINKNIPLYKRIRHFTIRESEFAKTTTKKIKRYAEKVG
ncbi:MAG: AMP-binding protein [Clostridia bacterium]|nr:AMP-binding protein [Clostridia bacterium]